MPDNSKNNFTGKDALPNGYETILVVDDEPEIVDIACAHLESLGYNTKRAYDGKMALELVFQDDGIQMIFSDVKMPGYLNGFEVAHAAISCRPNLKVLLASGYVDNNTPLNDNSIYDSFAGTLLRKPYTRTELAFSVRETLDKS